MDVIIQFLLIYDSKKLNTFGIGENTYMERNNDSNTINFVNTHI